MLRKGRIFFQKEGVTNRAGQKDGHWLRINQEASLWPGQSDGSTAQLQRLQGELGGEDVVIHRIKVT